MSNQIRKTAQLGEMVAAAFDGAERYSADPRVVARLATGAVARLLRHAHRVGRAGPVESSSTGS